MMSKIVTAYLLFNILHFGTIFNDGAHILDQGSFIRSERYIAQSHGMTETFEQESRIHILKEYLHIQQQDRKDDYKIITSRENNNFIELQLNDHYSFILWKTDSCALINSTTNLRETFKELKLQ